MDPGLRRDDERKMTFDFKKHKDQLLFVPLGGSNEIGMNLNLYTINGKWLMVDCGIGFANESLPGIDVVVPDISFIVEHKENLLGLVLTPAQSPRRYNCPPRSPMRMRII